MNKKQQHNKFTELLEYLRYKTNCSALKIGISWNYLKKYWTRLTTYIHKYTKDYHTRTISKVETLQSENGITYRKLTNGKLNKKGEK